MASSYKERMDEYRKRIDSDYHDLFTELVGHGSNPKAIGASIEYVTTTATQEEAADNWDCSQVAVRSNYPAILAMLDRDGVEPSAAPETAIDVVEEIAENLGWEEGDEYSVSRAYSSATANVAVNKPGLVSVRDAVVGDTNE
jgi:hypothetical protein